MSTARRPGAPGVSLRSPFRGLPSAGREIATALGSPYAAWAALAVLVIGTGGLLMYWTRGTTLWFDEWTWLLHRRGHALSSYLASHDGHMSLIPVAIYKALFATAGLRHSWPYRALMIAEHLAICALVFVYARRRVWAALALAAASLLLLFGPGWENLLWSFQITWNTSLLAGVAALLALDRDDRAGDIAACVLLLVSLASSGIGVPILIGVALEVVLVRRRAPREWWIVAVPVLLYALWAIDYQHTVIRRNAFTAAPSFVTTGLASTFGGLAGLGGSTGIDGPGTLMTWGPLLLLTAIGLAAWRLVRLRRVEPRVVGLATIVLAFWTITAITRYVFANPYSSRYLYVSALFVVLLAVELGRRARPGVRLKGLLVALAAVAIVSNLGALRDAARALRDQGLLTRADLGAAEIGRPLVAPGYYLNAIPGAPLVLVPARAYFAAARDVGTPAASPSQILAAPESAREMADKELIGIHGLSLRPTPAGLRLGAVPVVDAASSGATSEHGACVAFASYPFTSAAAATPSVAVTVPPAGLVLEATGASTSLGVRRFGAGFQPLGTLSPGAPVTLVIAPDRSPQPWHVLLATRGRALACGL